MEDGGVVQCRLLQLQDMQDVAVSTFINGGSINAMNGTYGGILLELDTIFC